MSDAESSRRAREDAIWQDIVAHYSETAPERPAPGAPEPPEDRAEDQDGAAADASAQSPADPASPPSSGGSDRPTTTPQQSWFSLADHEEFVPPDPPPAGLPRSPARLLAWLGVLGVPVVVLVLALTDAAPPVLADVGLLLWFLAGFGYLVATMRGGDDDSYDDGAVV